MDTVVLDRAAILAASDCSIETVDISEWGGPVAIKTFDGATRSKLIKPTKDGAIPDDWVERIIVATVCDLTGKLLFTEADIPELSKKSAVVLEKIFTLAAKLNGLSADAVEKEKGESQPTPK
jgi:hypothetical protein